MRTLLKSPVRFPLGRVVATPGALAALILARQTPWALLRRHQSGDWGSLDAHDLQENEAALKRGGRLFSAYDLVTGQRLWIITESDRSATTLLLPEEY